jgi:hypothetical protein
MKTTSDQEETSRKSLLIRLRHGIARTGIVVVIIIGISMAAVFAFRMELAFHRVWSWFFVIAGLVLLGIGYRNPAALQGRLFASHDRTVKRTETSLGEWSAARLAAVIVALGLIVAGTGYGISGDYSLVIISVWIGVPLWILLAVGEIHRARQRSRALREEMMTELSQKRRSKKET